MRCAQMMEGDSAVEREEMKRRGKIWVGSSSAGGVKLGAGEDGGEEMGVMDSLGRGMVRALR